MKEFFTVIAYIILFIASFSFSAYIVYRYMNLICDLFNLQNPLKRILKNIKEWIREKKGEKKVSIANMKRSETTEQINLIAWAERNKYFIPELKLLYHVPNEGKRTNGGLLKMAGVKAGVPDLCLPVARLGFHGLYVEMKFGKNKPTKEQEAFMGLLQQQNYKTAVAYSYEQAREIIRHYLAKTEMFDLVNCEEAIKIFNFCEGVAIDYAPCKECQFYKGSMKGERTIC